MEKHYDVTNINWNDLRHQKLELLKAITKRNLTDDPLEGIVSLIDSIQDHVVDDLGYNPNEVYLLEEPDPDFPCDPLSKVDTNPDEPEEQKFAREMSELIYDLHREASYLYEHEAMSEGFVETILNDTGNVQACKELIRKDILQDFANDPDQFQRNPNTNALKYESDMFDYGYVIEGYCLEKYYEGKTKTVHLCKCCHSDNVEIKHWLNPNTGKLGDAVDVNAVGVNNESVGYCNDCQLPTTVYTAELKYLAEVIGFQVVSDNDKGEIHLIWMQASVYIISHKHKP
jgi:hypothetical protein